MSDVIVSSSPIPFSLIIDNIIRFSRSGHSLSPPVVARSFRSSDSLSSIQSMEIRSGIPRPPSKCHLIPPSLASPNYSSTVSEKSPKDSSVITTVIIPC